MVGAAVAILVVVWLAVMWHFCGCASSVRTSPASAGVVETTRMPDGTVKTKQATATTAAGAANGDKTNLDQKNGAPTVRIGDGVMEANGGTAVSDLSATMSGLSLFWWAAILSIAGGVAMLALKQIRLGLWALGFAAMFALCAYSPLFLLGVAAVGMLSLYHTGRSFEGLRAVVSVAKKQGAWQGIKDKLHEVADFGDHAAVNAAEKAET